MAKDILVKPLITEKGELLSEEMGQYSFIVNKKANKIEIRKAVEELYGVSVKSVNTLVLPAKAKNRQTKAGYVRGRTSAYKKAIIRLDEGEEIDFFGDI